ncbi:CLUMA_CG014867, isoform A [Clunio marinus]|uniref:CLUMA_CG014867, isoform A n=1 Tax=Clunio marinus TaxID=568069 RepID=A0A1J1IQ32_9DIPT|nr:CLUMA_CG014867, isoform A [Clunio marinus]
MKHSLKEENITECGWKFVKDHKVDEIAADAFIYTTSLVNLTTTNFVHNNDTVVEEKTFKYIVKSIRNYCNPEVYIGSTFNTKPKMDLQISSFCIEIDSN